MGCGTVCNACETFEQQFPCCAPPQALDAAQLEKDQLRRGQHARSPVCSDWHSVVPPSDCTPPPEPLASPHLVVSSGEDNTSYTTISISPPAAPDGTQDNAVNTASVNGEPQGSGAPPDGGNGESAAPSSGRCAGPWSPPAPSGAALTCKQSCSLCLKQIQFLKMWWTHFLQKHRWLVQRRESSSWQ